VNVRVWYALMRLVRSVALAARGTKAESAASKLFAHVENMRVERGIVRRNPPLVVFANPGNRRTEVKSVCVNRVGFLSHEVHSVAYRHCDDGELYKHDFERATDLIACKTDDGRKVLVILNPDGEPVWEDFS
jgi:hypothetical protein